MKTPITKLLATISLLLVFSNTSLAKGEEGFSDVNSGNKNYMAITYLQSLGLVSGYDDGSFKPSSKINRAEAIKMITLACGLNTEETSAEPDGTTIAQPFSDTPLDAWYTEYLTTAKNKNIISGYPDGSFKPDQNVNLVEALKIYFECVGTINYPEGTDYSYADTDPEAWYIKYTNYANSKDILTVNLDNKISPDHEISRGELAEIIYRQMLLSDGFDFGKATYYGAAVHGNNTASGEIFDMNALTAAHKTLPFGTMVEVTNLANGKFVTVKITDRGPYGAGRVIDLSSGAFQELASLSTGVINVRYRTVQ